MDFLPNKIKECRNTIRFDMVRLTLRKICCLYSLPVQVPVQVLVQVLEQVLLLEVVNTWKRSVNVVFSRTLKAHEASVKMSSGMCTKTLVQCLLSLWELLPARRLFLRLHRLPSSPVD